MYTKSSFLFIFIIGISLLFANCSLENRSSKQSTGMESPEAMPPEAMEEMAIDGVRLNANYQADKTSNDEESHAEKLIKEGQLQFEVSDINSAKTSVDQVVNDLGGYYEHEQYHSYGDRLRYELQIRVPSESLDSMIARLEAHDGKLLSKELSVDDVTAEYIDLNIRLENKIAYLQQYKVLLKKAKTIKEILEVQEKIRRLEAEIESKKGRIKYIDNKAKYASLRVELMKYQRSVKSHTRFFTRVADAFESGFHGFLSFIIVMVNLWPFLLMLGLTLIFRQRVFGIFRRNK